MRRSIFAGGMFAALALTAGWTAVGERLSVAAAQQEKKAATPVAAKAAPNRRRFPEGAIAALGFRAGGHARGKGPRENDFGRF